MDSCGTNGVFYKNSKGELREFQSVDKNARGPLGIECHKGDSNTIAIWSDDVILLDRDSVKGLIRALASWYDTGSLQVKDSLKEGSA